MTFLLGSSLQVDLSSKLGTRDSRVTSKFRKQIFWNCKWTVTHQSHCWKIHSEIIEQRHFRMDSSNNNVGRVTRKLCFFFRSQTIIKENLKNYCSNWLFQHNIYVINSSKEYATYILNVKFVRDVHVWKVFEKSKCLLQMHLRIYFIPFDS